MRLRISTAIPVLGLALSLAACGQATSPQAAPAQAAPTAAVATSVPPTVVPVTEPTAAPTIATDATPQPAALLPAPLLFVDSSGQIKQIGTDGQTVITLTAEDAQVIQFAVSPADGRLAYLAIPPGGQQTHLIVSAADGSGRTELLRGILRGVTIAPDGQSVQVGVLQSPAQGAAGELAPGVWSIPLGVGEATLLQAATLPAGSGDTLTPGTTYQPHSWSPDGERLLMLTTPDFGPNSPAGDIGSLGLAVYELAAGQARELRPGGSQPLCPGPTWGHTGVTLYCPNSLYVSDSDPALWRLDLASGAVEPLLPGSAGQDTYTVVAAVEERDDGLYTLVGTSTPAQAATEFTLRRIAPGGEQADLLATPIQVGPAAIFAPDGSGVVASTVPAGAAGITLTWHPLDGSTPIPLGSAGDTGSAQLAWGFIGSAS